MSSRRWDWRMDWSMLWALLFTCTIWFFERRHDYYLISIPPTFLHVWCKVDLPVLQTECIVRAGGIARIGHSSQLIIPWHCWRSSSINHQRRKEFWISVRRERNFLGLTHSADFVDIWLHTNSMITSMRGSSSWFGLQTQRTPLRCLMYTKKYGTPFVTRLNSLSYALLKFSQFPSSRLDTAQVELLFPCLVSHDSITVEAVSFFLGPKKNLFLFLVSEGTTQCHV